MSSKSDDLCIGIYFGASSTLVSYADSKTKNTQYPLIENSTGSYKTPSVVAFPNDSPPLIGEAALDYAKIDPTKVFTNIKLFLGQKLHDPKMEHLFQNCPNKVIADADDNPLFFTLEMVCIDIIGYPKRNAFKRPAHTFKIVHFGLCHGKIKN